MEELSFHRLLLQTREQRGDNLGFVEGEVRESSAEHIDVSLQLVRALRSAGVARGERIALLGHASRRFVNGLHAAALGGWIAVPLNTRLAAPELAELLRDSDPAVVLVDAAHLAALEQTLRLVRAEPRIVLLDLPAEAAGPHWSLADLLAAETAEAPPEPAEDEPVLMLYTGGTTGRSKGALCTNRQLVLSLHRLQFQLDVMAAGATMISMNPLFHIGAINAAYAFPSAGSTVVLHPSFDPDLVVQAAQTHRVTHLSALVAILQRLMSHPRFSPSVFSSLRYVTYGANPIPVDLLADVLTAFPGVEVQQSYGMTEAFGGVTCLSGADHLAGGARLSSVGRALPGVVVSIRDPDGRVLPRGEAGGVCIASGSVSTRYWGADPDVPSAPYLDSGDIGRMDELGYLYLLDRAKDMIKTGGENVYSIEVEAVLGRHPAVEAVAVIGLPDETWGERVHAVVVVRPDTPVTAGELRTFARADLAAFKVPKSIEVRSRPLPTSSIGKVLKRQLRAEHLASADAASDS